MVTVRRVYLDEIVTRSNEMRQIIKSRDIHHAGCQLDPSNPDFSSWNLIQRAGVRACIYYRINIHADMEIITCNLSRKSRAQPTSKCRYICATSVNFTTIWNGAKFFYFFCFFFFFFFFFWSGIVERTQP